MQRNSRDRRKTIAIVASILAGITFVACLLLSMRQKRTEFVGNVDPTSGIRCRFLLAADWKRTDNLVFTKAPGYVDEAEFSAPPPGPIRKWIEAHLLRKPFPLWHKPVIYLVSLSPSTSLLGQYLQIQAGYPELLSTNIPSTTRFTQRHLRIDGCPATVLTVTDRNYSSNALLVYVPEASVAYMISGLSWSQNTAQVDHEMQAIVSSFHIEKVATAGSKR